MSSPLLVDTPAIFGFQQHLKDRDFLVHGNPNYGNLLDGLRKSFPKEVFDPKIAFVSINFDNEGQKRFMQFLQSQDFLVDAADYRDAYVLPDRANPYQRFSARLTYVAGMLSSKQPPPHLVAVTDAFDTYYALHDYVQTRGGRVTIAFFRSGMEARWQRVGLFNEDSPIKFLDLDPYAKAIIGADLGSNQTPTGKTGLGSLKI